MTKKTPHDGEVEHKETDLVSPPPERIPGFDVEEGVARIGGDSTLYRRLLGKFPTTASRQMKALREAVAARETPAVQVAAHTLKGSAGVAAAVEIRAIAYELENAAANGEVDRYPALMERLEDAFGWAVNSLREVLDEPIEIDTDPPVQGTDSLEKEHWQALANVQTLLEAQDFEARSRYATIIRGLGRSCPAELRDIGDLIEDFDFVTAKARLKELLRNRPK